MGFQLYDFVWSCKRPSDIFTRGAHLWTTNSVPLSGSILSAVPSRSMLRAASPPQTTGRSFRSSGAPTPYRRNLPSLSTSVGLGTWNLKRSSSFTRPAPHFPMTGAGKRSASLRHLLRQIFRKETWAQMRLGRVSCLRLLQALLQKLLPPSLGRGRLLPSVHEALAVPVPFVPQHAVVRRTH